MRKVIVTKLENFQVWESYEVMMKYKGILDTFVNNGILKDGNSYSYLKELYEIYKSYCLNFYNNLKMVYSNYYEKTDNGLIDFNIDYNLRIYEMQLESGTFNLENFALNNLDFNDIRRQEFTNIVMKESK